MSRPNVEMPWRTFGYLLLLFLAALLAGYLFATGNPDAATEGVRKLAGRMGPLSNSSFRNFIRIFTNNSLVALFMFLSGLFFGLGPWVIMAFNGFMVGLVVEAVQKSGRLSTHQIILGLLPHGVIEIPAIALAGVSGIVWYRELIRGEGETGERFKRGAKEGAKILAVSVLLLLIAAAIEAYVTPRVAGL
ncbi:stage II sporulation protein M [Thermococcus celer]|uniref:Stage II sporulation protein M n=1 Tax=Thermococcus celer Vu 13 = JCM 8558 TaxID=1293037 RepID=A0A218P0R4_THECE|nr:stage II sporulation protein M [Thermococcus celer]ASI98521.1 hypothetical protein A3L02_02530 [Thermococcus celer Vu 13 = JCM 8558]